MRLLFRSWRPSSSHATRKHLRAVWCWPCNLAVFAVLHVFVILIPSASATLFYMGADTSLITFMQQQNVVFFDNGVAKPVDQLLYDRGANLFRLRIFVNPQANYTNQNYGAIQSLE